MNFENYGLRVGTSYLVNEAIALLYGVGPRGMIYKNRPFGRLVSSGAPNDKKIELTDRVFDGVASLNTLSNNLFPMTPQGSDRIGICRISISRHTFRRKRGIDSFRSPLSICIEIPVSSWEHH